MSNPALDISNLLYRYAELFDAGRFDDVAALFDKAHLLIAGHEIRGRENIVAMWREIVIVYDCGTPRTRHLVTNPLIELSSDGQSASCRSQWTVLQQTDSLQLQVIGTGRYHDEFALDGGKWRFASRDYSRVDFWGDASHHLKNPPPKEEN
jgi:3-phenylpropionate/cinnamic acid dioxygenase small subunit